MPTPELRTIRRSNTPAHGVVRHALQYLMRAHGLERDDCKLISVAVRSTFLEVRSAAPSNMQRRATPDHFLSGRALPCAHVRAC